MVGKIKVMFEPMSFASGFTKREFVLILEDDYPQDIKFVCVKEKCAQLDSVVVGDRVKVDFRIRGKEYKERYYVDLDVFQIEKLEGGAASVPCEDADPFSRPDDPILPF
jgi:hypothetical protein